MRIAHVVDSLALGGLEKLVVDLAKVQKQQGHDISVLCLSTCEGELASELRINGIDAIGLNKKSGFSLSLLRNIACICKRKRLEVIHTHNPVANFYGAIGGRMAGVKSIVTTRHGMGNYPFNKKREHIFKFSSLFTDKIIFVCNTARENFIRLRLANPKKSFVVYNGVHLKNFSKSNYKDAAKIREELNIKEEKIIGTIARLDPVKDISTLIKAAKRLLQIEKKLKFLIVGDGPEYGRLQLLRDDLGLHESILFLGKRNDIAKLLSVIDIFVLPSISEGMSLTLLEAMAAGKAIVATKVGGNPEVIVNEKTGVLVPSKNEEELASAISSLLSDSQTLFFLGVEARKRAYELFDLKKMAENYYCLYQERHN